MPIQNFKIKQDARVKSHIPSHLKNRKSFFKKENGEAEKFRSSKRWQALREQILYRYPLCFICGRAAFEVHHIEQISGNPEMTFEVSNLAPLCDDCHEKVHGAYRRRIKPIELFPLDKRVILE
jgi:5-methylcytosine-specific restriction endonuclease McrA